MARLSPVHGLGRELTMSPSPFDSVPQTDDQRREQHATRLRDLGIETRLTPSGMTRTGDCPACGGKDALVVTSNGPRCTNSCGEDTISAALDELTTKRDTERERKRIGDEQVAEREEREYRESQREYYDRLSDAMKRIYDDLPRAGLDAEGIVTRCPACLGESMLIDEVDGAISVWCPKKCDKDQLRQALGLPTTAEEDSRLTWDEPEPPRWLIPDVIAEGQFVSIVGKRESGKSLYMLDCALQMAAAGERVLYLDAENQLNEILLRLKAMGVNSQPTGLDYRFLSDAIYLDTEAGASKLARMAGASHNGLGATVVMLDTWSKFVQGPENASETHTRAYVGAILPLRREHVTTVVGDHLGKDKSAGPRGGSSKSDNVDVEWTLTADGRGAPVRVTLASAKDRTHRCPNAVQLQRLATLRHVDLSSGQALDPKVAEAVAALDVCGVPVTAGREKARQMLAEREYGFRTAVVGVALKVRREREEVVLPTLSAVA